MKKKYIFAILFLVTTLSYSCRKHSNDNNINEPTRSYLDTLNTSLKIQVKGQYIIDSAINSVAFKNMPLDLQSIINKINKIDSVKNAVVSSSGVSINIEKLDGSYCTLLIYTKNDNRLIQKTSIKTFPTAINLPKVNDISSPNPYTNSNIFPLNKKALILAPFQHDFLEQTETIHLLLSDAGYTTTVLYDNEVTKDKLTGDYLAQFGVIYITTHGFEAVMKDGRTTFGFLSGTPYSRDQASQYTPFERQFMVISGPDKDHRYLAATVPYLERTLTKRFPNSWVFFDACESGDHKDLEDFFLKNGAVGFNGFHGKTTNIISDCIAVELTSLLTSGYNFNQACNNIRYNQGIYETLIEWIGNNYISVNGFYYNASTGTPFTLVNDPGGYGAVSPNYGTSGTKFDLTLKLNYNKTLNTKTVFYNYPAQPSNDSAIDTLLPPKIPQTPNVNTFFSFTGNNTMKVYPTFKYPQAGLIRFSLIDLTNNPYNTIRMTIPFTIHDY